MENYSFERMILFCFFGLSLIGEPHPIAKFPFKDKRDSEESLCLYPVPMILCTDSFHSPSPQNFFSLLSFRFVVLPYKHRTFQRKIHYKDQAFTTGYFSSTFLMVEAMSSFSTERSISSSFFT